MTAIEGLHSTLASSSTNPEHFVSLIGEISFPASSYVSFVLVCNPTPEMGSNHKTGKEIQIKSCVHRTKIKSAYVY